MENLTNAIYKCRWPLAGNVKVLILQKGFGTLLEFTSSSCNFFLTASHFCLYNLFDFSAVRWRFFSFFFKNKSILNLNINQQVWHYDNNGREVAES